MKKTYNIGDFLRIEFRKMLGLGIDIDTDSKYHININFIIGIFLLQFTIYKKQMKKFILIT